MPFGTSSAPLASVLTDAGRVAYDVSPPQEEWTEVDLADRRKVSERYDGYRAHVEKQVLARWASPPDKENDPFCEFRWARAAYAEAVCRHRPGNPAIPADHPDPGFRIGFYRGAAVQPNWDVQAF